MLRSNVVLWCLCSGSSLVGKVCETPAQQRFNQPHWRLVSQEVRSDYCWCGTRFVSSVFDSNTSITKRSQHVLVWYFMCFKTILLGLSPALQALQPCCCRHCAVAWSAHIVHGSELYKNGQTNPNAVCRTDSCSPREPCIRWDPDPPMREMALLMDTLSFPHYNQTSRTASTCILADISH